MSITAKEDLERLVNEYWKERKKPDYWGVMEQISDSRGYTIAYKVLVVKHKENYDVYAAIRHGLKNGLSLGEILVEYFWFVKDSIVGINDVIHAIEAWKKFGKDIRFFAYNEEDLKNPPKELWEVHVRLALLSRRFKKPNEINLEGAFKLLPNLVWTNVGPFTVEDWNQKLVKGETDGIVVLAVDKFPPFFLWNPVPEGVRVANADMVRAGAHLASGTTVMHYGFVNFNAGTLGKSMVEGRISAGTVVDEGTDMGAGGGFLGTLSGGNSIKMKAGKNCLVGAMSEVGVPLGDNCTVATGTCFAPGTPVYDLDEQCWKKAIDFKDQNNLLIWRNSKNGRIEVQRKKVEVSLNEELHQND